MFVFLYHFFCKREFASTTKYLFVFNNRDECCAFLDGINRLCTNMTIINRLRITISHFRLHAASSVRIPYYNNSFRTLLPTVRMRPLNLFSTSSVDLHGTSNTYNLCNNLQVRLSPIKSPVLHKYPNPFKRPSMYPSISKCNVKSCNCCEHVLV